MGGDCGISSLIDLAEHGNQSSADRLFDRLHSELHRLAEAHLASHHPDSPGAFSLLNQAVGHGLPPRMALGIETEPTLVSLRRDQPQLQFFFPLSSFFFDLRFPHRAVVCSAQFLDSLQEEAWP